MSDQLENKSVPELLDTATEIIKEYNILFTTILGTTPEESKEMRKILERFEPWEIKKALIAYRGGKPHERSPPDMMTEEMKRLIKGFKPWEVARALTTYRGQNPIPGRIT